MRLHCLMVFGGFLVMISDGVDGKCSRLPSGNCWVNCLQEIFDVICNNITADQLQNDIRVFSGTYQLFRLYLWSSPGIDRLSADVFYSVATQIVVLDLQDVSELRAFPEVNELVRLKRFSIWNSPKLHNLALELLPSTIWKIALSKVGISYFENDFIEVPQLTNLQILVLRNLTISGWEGNFLGVFPNLSKFEISNSTLNIPPSSQHFARTAALSSFKVVQNEIWQSSNDTDDKVDFLSQLVRSVSMSVNGSFDLSNNNYQISDVFIKDIQKFHDISRLILRGNTLTAASASLRNVFDEFSYMTTLDLGETNLKAIAGLLGGLPKLSSLYLDHNLLTDMSKVNIFDGFYGTNLTFLDLSYNLLESLPVQESFRDAVRTLLELNLKGNRLQLFQQSQLDERMQQVLKWLGSLRKLNVAANNLTSFVGGHLSSMTNLKVLDLSCNPLEKVTRMIFEGMGENISDVDVSPCIHAPTLPPWIDMDAFTTLPGNLKVLRLNSGAFKKGIFRTLNFSNQTYSSLLEVHLQDNDISFIDEATISNFPELQVLNLKQNSIQSVGPRTFVNVPKLQTLLLSENRLISVGPESFAGESGQQLQNLEVLDLANNDITGIYPGAFNQLPNLKALFLGGNEVEVQGLFLAGVPSLEYLGMQGYNKSCLRPDFFQELPKLKWIFENQYNLIRVQPDNSLFTRDDFLLATISICDYGKVENDHEMYPGLDMFVSVNVHDSDDLFHPLQYPIITAFMPLNYCPSDPYVESLGNLICSEPVRMMQSSELNFD